MQAVETQISMQQQLTANKRLDFELARLKNCGEQMKLGVMFHPNSPFHAVCADVVLVNPPGVVAPHQHDISPVDYKVELEEPKEVSYGDASVLQTVSIGNPIQ